MVEDDRASGRTLELTPVPRRHAWALDIQDAESSRRILLTQEELAIGSSRGADVVVSDRAVSGRHCVVSALGAGIRIVDLGSRNGTFVGTARVSEAWGGPGTTMTIGQTTIVCASVGEEGPDEDEIAEPLPTLAGASPAMRKVAAQVRRLARHSAPVLVSGESGTGKELVARALHVEGPRALGPFVAVNVAALPRELVESEMFGHERGAFTGAVARRAGAFTDADGGTLFLDEIGDLPVDAQPKLLRALDGYEVRRVGGSQGKRPNVRVVAATHVPLDVRVAAGQFRRDLFHRLEVFVVLVPPLRARRGDIAPIARHLLAQMEHELGRRMLSSAAIARLSVHDWPGNVRELRNVLYRACDAAKGTLIEARDIERGFRAKEEAERLVVTPKLARAILKEKDNNLSAAARAAGCPRTTFRKLVNRK